MDASTVQEGLTPFIREKTGRARSVNVENLVRLSGGASRETWSFDARIRPAGGRTDLEAIFRCDPIAGQSNRCPDAHWSTT